MQNRSVTSSLLLFALVMFLAACGSKGALYLPEKDTTDSASSIEAQISIEEPATSSSAAESQQGIEEDEESKQ